MRYDLRSGEISVAAGQCPEHGRYLSVVGDATVLIVRPVIEYYRQVLLDCGECPAVDDERLAGHKRRLV